MTAVSRTANYKSSIMVLALTVGLGALIASPGDSWAARKLPTIQIRCTCNCVYTQPNGFKVWSLIIFNNTSGLLCGANDGQTCTYTAGNIKRKGETSSCKTAEDAPLR